MDFKLIEKREEAKGTKSFFFEPKEKIDWLPGQYFYITLPKLTHEDPKGNIRHFTNAASPTEGNVMRVTTRVRAESGFKQTLDELEIGQGVEGKGPNGIFNIDENTKGNHVFLAGGIGITPFRSMTKYAIDKNLNINIHLIFSNPTAESVAFKNEIENWAQNSPHFKLHSVITDKVGHIDQKMMAEILKNWKLETRNLTFWASGPPEFVTAMEDILSKMRTPLDNVRTEKFTGY